jgi:hypothetical protein
MGKVLSNFTNGWPGAVSRSVDEIILSLRNGSDGKIPFGAAVFFIAGTNACAPFDPDNAANFSMDNFIGITVRSGVKTPEVYGSNEAAFNEGDPVEILTRGAIVLQFDHGVDPGATVYIRKADGAFVTNPGAEGTTLALTNVHVKTASDSENRAEVVVLERNLL